MMLERSVGMPATRWVEEQLLAEIGIEHQAILGTDRSGYFHGANGGVRLALIDWIRLANYVNQQRRTETCFVVSSGTHPARMITRARVLLALDESQGDAPDRRVVAERVGTSESTVYLLAKAFATQGGRIEEVIGRKKRTTPPVEPKVTGDVEARLIALACSQPPPGRQRWTLRLLEKHVLLTEGIPPMDHSTIGRVLKRGRSSLT